MGITKVKKAEKWEKWDFYELPIKSSYLDIYTTDGQFSKFSTKWSLSSIKKKFAIKEERILLVSQEKLSIAKKTKRALRQLRRTPNFGV